MRHRVRDMLIAAAVLLAASTALAQAPADKSPLQKPPATAGADEVLALEQQRIGEKYKHLEDVLLRMAELSASADPRRAALLKKAVAQSKERLVGVQFEQLAELLRKGQLSRALENQDGLDKDLRALMELLMSENRAKQLESEKARLRQYLKQLSELIRRQKDIQGRTGGAADPKPLSAEQSRLADQTGGLAKDIQRNEEGQSGEPDKADKKTEGGSDAKNKSNKQGQGKSQSPPSGGKQPQGGQEGQGGKQGQGSDAEQPAQQKHPARTRLEAARQRMDEAQKQLEQAKRNDAVQKQEEAIRELERARADLEEVLRQLREEEIGRTLTTLEVRFQRMLERQRAIYAATQRLDKTPKDQRGHNHEIEAGRLSNDESLLVIEADKALALLREEGSAVALPEAIVQMRADMQQVVARLAQARVDSITQAIEEDILAALEEMIAALQKAIDKLEERKQQPPAARQGQPAEEPLVDQLSELKMIRAMQMRVNRRTERYSKLLAGPQAEKGELLDALKRLAEREAEIHRITRDIEMGKNQ